MHTTMEITAWELQFRLQWLEFIFFILAGISLSYFNSSDYSLLTWSSNLQS